MMFFPTSRAGTANAHLDWSSGGLASNRLIAKRTGGGFGSQTEQGVLASVVRARIEIYFLT